MRQKITDIEKTRNLKNARRMLARAKNRLEKAYLRMERDTTETNIFRYKMCRFHERQAWKHFIKIYNRVGKHQYKVPRYRKKSLHIPK